MAEAREKAEELGVDLVLRNENLNPPIMKVMNYRKELVKRLFQKLGKNATQEADDPKKQKSLKLSTSINMHDLENKKRKAVEFLKKFPVVNFYMRVNKYDPDNIQKGKIMLLNIAEGLKSYAKLKVSVLS